MSSKKASTAQDAPCSMYQSAAARASLAPSQAAQLFAGLAGPARTVETDGLAAELAQLAEQVDVLKAQKGNNVSQPHAAGETHMADRPQHTTLGEGIWDHRDRPLYT